MTRQLVVCLDGTGNRFSHRPTNIVRLLRSLSTRPSEVLGYYDQGVGTFGLKETLFEWQKLPSRICGLAFGWGLKRNVQGAYEFLAENWVEGDEIFIFGFSRGAYAARAVAALIRAAGLVPPHGAHLFDYAWSMLLARVDPERKPDFKLQARFKATFGRTVRVRFLGLFDTVKSVGWVYDQVVIPYTTNNPAVEIVRHAVSIDERRCFFRQNLWGSPQVSKTDVKQVWFAGVHSDIGGGYKPKEAQLALIAHRWMLGEAAVAGLKLDADRCMRNLAAEGAAADFSAGSHDSMTLGWKVAEWIPRRVWDERSKARRWRIGAMPPFGTPRARELRPVHTDDSDEGVRQGPITVHRSVAQRLQAAIGYDPQNLPGEWEVADDAPLFVRRND